MTVTKMFAAPILILGLTAAAGCATMEEETMKEEMGAPVKEAKTKIGMVLTDAKGMTLYTFDKDTSGMSNCYGKCAESWPPLMASRDDKGMGDFIIITRKDGSKQWALKDKPLYTWVKDSKPGDVTGDGFKDVWHAAQP